MSTRVVQVLVALAALGVSASAAAVVSLGDSRGHLYAYASEGRVTKAARVVGTTALRDPAPIMLEETIIVAPRPRSPAVKAPVTLTACGDWRRTAAGPRARATDASEVRSCDGLPAPVVHETPPAPAVPPRASEPTMVFDYAVDAPSSAR